MRRVVVLPQPEGPSNANNFTVLNGQVNLINSFDRAEVFAEISS